MFDHPAQAWNAALLSECWQIGPRQVRARLFAEGEALLALVREQRAARALYALAMQAADTEYPEQTMTRLARRAGLRTARMLNDTCASLFGIELKQLMAASAEAAHATKPTTAPWHLPLALTT